MDLYPQHTLSSLVHGVLSEEESIPSDLAGLQVGGLKVDSRTVNAGDVFVAYRGESVDGRKFISQCKHASVVLSEADEFEVDAGGAPPIVHVPNLRARIGKIAANYYGHPTASLSVVGITGTNGKTTCAFLLAQVLANLGMPSGILGTLGYGIISAGCQEFEGLIETGLTTPSAIDCQRIADEIGANSSALVMEVSSHGLAQSRVVGIQFDGAIFTNLTQDHLDYHSSMEEYGEEKAKLFEYAELMYCVINLDDEFGLALLKRDSVIAKRKVGFSVKGISADLKIELDSLGVDVIEAFAGHSSLAGVRAKITTPWGESKFESHIIGRFNVSNLLAVIGAATAMGFKLDEVCAAVSDVKGVPGRLEQVIPSGRAKSAPVVYIDFAHTPDALEKAILELRPYAKRLGVVVGCGGDRDSDKRPKMAAAASAYCELLVITSDNPRSESALEIIRQMYVGIDEKNLQSTQVERIEDRQAAIKFAVNWGQKGDVVLVAGKGHEKFQIVNGKKTPFNDYSAAKACLDIKSA